MSWLNLAQVSFGFSQEREDYALYCDARVVKIQRKMHDPTGCTCTFFVLFLHDNTEVIFDLFFFLINDPFEVVSYVKFSILTLSDVVSYVFARKKFLGTGYAVGLEKKNVLSTQVLPLIPPKLSPQIPP